MSDLKRGLLFLSQVLLLGSAFANLLFYSQEVSAYSPKEGNILATLGPFLYRTNFQDVGHGGSSDFQNGLTLILNGDVSDYGQLEIATTMLRKRFLRDLNGVFVGEETDQVHIAMGYRHWFSPSFSGGMGFHSAYAMGEPRFFQNEFNPQRPIDTSARDTVEYGFDFSLQAELLEVGRFALTLTGVYSLSVTAKPNERADHYGGLLGLRYFVQEKQVVQKPREAI